MSRKSQPRGVFPTPKSVKVETKVSDSFVSSGNKETRQGTMSGINRIARPIKVYRKWEDWAVNPA